MIRVEVVSSIDRVAPLSTCGAEPGATLGSRSLLFTFAIKVGQRRKVVSVCETNRELLSSILV